MGLLILYMCCSGLFPLFFLPAFCPFARASFPPGFFLKSPSPNNYFVVVLAFPTSPMSSVPSGFTPRAPSLFEDIAFIHFALLSMLIGRSCFLRGVSSVPRRTCANVTWVAYHKRKPGLSFCLPVHNCIIAIWRTVSFSVLRWMRTTYHVSIFRTPRSALSAYLFITFDPMSIVHFTNASYHFSKYRHGTPKTCKSQYLSQLSLGWLDF